MNNALIARGGTPIDLDKSRTIFFEKKAAWLLIQKYGEDYLAKLYGPGTGVNGKLTVKLKDPDALEYFLWAGLQFEAEAAGEELTIEKVSSWFMPSTTMRIFDGVIVAITRNIHTPPLPGKATAVAASPAAPAKKAGKPTASTSRKRSASPSVSSAKRKRNSGRRR